MSNRMISNSIFSLFSLIALYIRTLHYNQTLFPCLRVKLYYPFTYGISVNWNRNNTSSNRYCSNTTGPQLLEPMPFNA